MTDVGDIDVPNFVDRKGRELLRALSKDGAMSTADLRDATGYDEQIINYRLWKLHQLGLVDLESVTAVQETGEEVIFG